MISDRLNRTSTIVFFLNTRAPVTNIPIVIIPFTDAIMPLKACLLEVFNYPYVSFIQPENLIFAGVVQTNWRGQEFFLINFWRGRKFFSLEMQRGRNFFQS